MSAPLKVYVTIYEHRHGTDIAVYATQALALAAKDEIADRWWEQEIGDTVPRPEGPVGTLGDAYFNEMGERDRSEHFTIEECGVAQEEPSTPEPAAPATDGLKTFSVELYVRRKEHYLVQAATAEDARDIVLGGEEGTPPCPECNEFEFLQAEAIEVYGDGPTPNGRDDALINQEL